jgi:beta-lactamase regulating signal transducer with metallopeptidase domain
MTGLGSLADPVLQGCRAVVQIGIGVALQSTLLLGLGFLLARRLGRHGPVLRSLIYQATLVSTLVSALISPFLGRHFQSLWSISLPPITEQSTGSAPSEGWSSGGVERGGLAGGPVLPDPLASSERARRLEGAQRGTAPSPGEASVLAETAVAADREKGALVSASRPPGARRIAGLYVAIAGLWMAGALLLLSRLLLVQRHLQHLRRNSVPVCEGVGAATLAELTRSLGVLPPSILASSQVRSPFLTGLWRPAILLPVGFEQQFDPPTLRAILAHELVHLGRGDCAWNLLARLACAVGWMQPLLWALSRKLEQASEEVCDQEVVRLDGDPRAYADRLLTLSEQLLAAPAGPILGVGVISFHSSLGQRIQQILAASQQQRLPVSPRLHAAVAMGAASMVAMGLFLVSAVAAPQDATDSAAGLKSVRELDRTVTYTETKIPLRELVQKIAAETGAPLTVSPDVADEPVAVVVKDLPARELLEQLADLLEYRWSRRGKPGQVVWEIYQDLAAKQREEALRRAAQAASEQRLQDQVRQFAQMARRPPEEIQALKEESDRRDRESMKTSPDQQLAFAASPEGRSWIERHLAASAVAAPIPRALAGFLARLTPQQWTTLHSGEPLLFSSSPLPDELPLPDETARLLHAARFPGSPSELPGAIVPPEMEASSRLAYENMQREWSSAAGYRVGIRLDVDQFESGGTLFLNTNAAPLGGPSDPFQFGPGADLTLISTPLDLPAQATKPELRAGWLKDPVLGRKESFKPPAMPQEPGFRSPFGPHWQFRDLLPELARVYGANFISDAYWGTGLRGDLLPSPVTAPLVQQLENLTGFTQQWERRGNLVRLRSDMWFFERPREIPLRFVRRWRESYEKHGGLSFSQYLEMATQLRDIQLRHATDPVMAGALPVARAMEFHAAYEARHALRLYTRLSAAKQQALQAGGTLSVGDMDPLEQVLFTRAVKELIRTRRNRKASQTPADWEAGTFTLSTRLLQRVPGPPGSPPFFHAETGSPGNPPGAPPTAPGPTPPPGPGGTPPRENLVRQPTQQCEFIFQLGPALRESVVLSTAAGTATKAPASGTPRGNQ